MTSTDRSTAEAAPDEETTRLEEEGDIAADYLEELLDIVDLDGYIDMDVEHDRATVSVMAKDTRDLRQLVGQDGAVLDAVQELTRLAVQARTGDRSRLMLDIAGFRAARRAELVELATEAIAKVKESGTKLEMDPLNAFERKVIHDAVAEAGMVSDSEGVDPERFVVIHPN